MRRESNARVRREELKIAPNTPILVMHDFDDGWIIEIPILTSRESEAFEYEYLWLHTDIDPQTYNSRKKGWTAGFHLKRDAVEVARRIAQETAMKVQIYDGRVNLARSKFKVKSAGITR